MTNLTKNTKQEQRKQLLYWIDEQIMAIKRQQRK